jgi:hypothetical protein
MTWEDILRAFPYQAFEHYIRYRPGTFSITVWYQIRVRRQNSRVFLWYADLNRN